jgi:hypothetical protein
MRKERNRARATCGVLHHRVLRPVDDLVPRAHQEVAGVGTSYRSTLTVIEDGGEDRSGVGGARQPNIQSTTPAEICRHSGSGCRQTYSARDLLTWNSMTQSW